MKQSTQTIPTGVQALLDLNPISTSSDIYATARSQINRENYEKYPYTPNKDDLTPEVIRRIERRSKTLNLLPEKGIELATNSPAGWLSMVIPTTEKQNYHEKALRNRLALTFMVEDLPASGKGAHYMCEGGVVETGLTKKPNTSQRSLDFKISLKNNDIAYVVAKYTQGGGGGQNSQADHASQALEFHTPDSGIYLLLILDGNYYTEEASGIRKMKELKQRIKDGKFKNAFAGTYEEAEEWLNQLESSPLTPSR